jgi:glycosyltransferase involved in cell wall biosynthesis
MKITAAIITFNEESNIRDAIRSVDWLDEILVVDSESTDRTVSIAKEMGARVISRPWPGFAAQKQFAADSAKNDWILSVDADERVSLPLREEISKVVLAGPDADGYSIPRLSFYMGRPIRHSGWYPDRQLRLYNRSKGRWKDVVVHESVEMSPSASTGMLRSELHHYSVESAAHHHRMIGERYAPLAAQKMFESGRRTSPLTIVSSGPLAFFRSFIWKLGLLDGLPGFCISRFAAHHAFLKHLILWELQNEAKESSHR